MQIRVQLGMILLMAGLSAPAHAAQWVLENDDGPAMRYDEGRFRPAFACAGGQLRSLVPGNGARFDSGRTYTVTFSIDGLAFLLRMRPSPTADGDAFTLTDAFSAHSEMMEALARGKEVEIATPAGRYRLPLKGTGRAVAALKTACG